MAGETTMPQDLGLLWLIPASDVLALLREARLRREPALAALALSQGARGLAILYVGARREKAARRLARTLLALRREVLEGGDPAVAALTGEVLFEKHFGLPGWRRGAAPGEVELVA